MSGRQRAEPPRLHGGRLTAARRLFPGAPEPFLDLSTGINPIPYPLPSLAAESFARLPEPEDVAALEAAAAAAYGVTDPACVVAAPGSQSLIGLIPHLWPARTAAILAPSYAEHAAAWRAAGAKVMERPDLPGLEGTDAAALVNPNNPDGRCHSAATVLALAGRMAARGSLLVVDEAFADLAPAQVSVAPLLPHPALIVLRSFGKTYGLAGLRLGFALLARERAARLRAALGPWAVSGPAVAIGRRALGDAPWRSAAKARLDAAAARLDARLAAAGLEVVGGTSLFRLARGGAAQDVFARLGRAGILVRRFAERPDWLRFGLPADEAAWARLDAALPRCPEAEKSGVKSAQKFPLDAAAPAGLDSAAGRSRQG